MYIYILPAFKVLQKKSQYNKIKDIQITFNRKGKGNEK